jgi:hypothetical protein
MLSPDDRQHARQYAERLSSMMKDEEREGCSQQAYKVIDMLREKFGDDGSAATCAQYIAYVLTAIAATPVGRAADLLDGSVGSYALAAANLAGVYDLPERKAHEHTAECESGPAVPATTPEASPSDHVGLYL